MKTEVSTATAYSNIKQNKNCSRHFHFVVLPYMYRSCQTAKLIYPCSFSFEFVSKANLGYAVVSVSDSYVAFHRNADEKYSELKPATLLYCLTIHVGHFRHIKTQLASEAQRTQTRELNNHATRISLFVFSWPHCRAEFKYIENSLWHRDKHDNNMIITQSDNP